MALHCPVKLDLLHLSQSGEPFCDLIKRELVTETHHIPQMQSGLAGSLLRTAVLREDPLYLISPDKVKDFID